MENKRTGDAVDFNTVKNIQQKEYFETVEEKYTMEAETEGIL